MIKKVKDLSDSAVNIAYKVSLFKKLSCHCFIKVFEVVLGDWKKMGVWLFWSTKYVFGS